MEPSLSPFLNPTEIWLAMESHANYLDSKPLMHTALFKLHLELTFIWTVPNFPKLNNTLSFYQACKIQMKILRDLSSTFPVIMTMTYIEAIRYARIQWLLQQSMWRQFVHVPSNGLPHMWTRTSMLHTSSWLDAQICSEETVYCI